MSVILVTGGSRGIGAACTRRFAAAGHRVAFLYRASEEKARALAASAGAMAIRADVSDSAQIAEAVKQVEMQFGEVDVLINNAGVSSFALLQDTSDAEWRRVMGINLDGAFYCARAVLPAMIRRKSGRIIQISSMWGRVGASMEVAYSTSKAALIGMTRALAKEVGPSGITVNCIAPGVIDTDMNRMLSSEIREQLAFETPIGRLGEPEEVAETAYFLASEAAAFITGQVLGVDGGYC